MTWPEEIHKLPREYGPGNPTFMLFANDQFYYFYHFEYDELLRAGKTLNDVYIGLEDRKYGLWNVEERWFSEPDNGEEYDYRDYFPDWTVAAANDREISWTLVNPLLPFIPHTVVHSGND
jgi:hypothetical protein